MDKQWNVLDSAGVSLAEDHNGGRKQELNEDGLSAGLLEHSHRRCQMSVDAYSVCHSILVREIKQRDASAWRLTVKQRSTVW